MREALFQQRLIKDIKDYAAARPAARLRVKKMQSGMGYTVLDLYVRCPVGAVWIELKTVPSLGTKVELTPLQRKDIRDEIEAGGNAGCIVCYKNSETGNEEVYWFNHNRVHIDKHDLITIRKKGEKFDVVEIIKQVFHRSVRS